MDFSMILDGLANQGIWCLLFVWLFYTDRVDSRQREEKLTEDSRQREEKLTAVITEHGEKLAEIAETLERINEKVDKLEKE